MSHSKERKEKICLNCNAELNGRFCHVCGQENIEPKQSVWELITHFFNDITHFDGKFFSTTGRLLSRPGFLPREYMIGRRARYLNPIRMYIFTSAIFFLIFFAFFSVNTDRFEEDRTEDADAILTRTGEELLRNSNTRKDSVVIAEQMARLRQGLSVLVEDTANTKKRDSLAAKKADSLATKRKKRNVNFSFTSIEYNTIAEYDSAQRALPEDQRDNWLKRKIEIRRIGLNNRYKEDRQQFWKDILTKFVHTFPYLLFVSLPLYALFLKLLYIRRKKYYYVDHGMFLVYLYIFTFIWILAFIGIDELAEALGWSSVFDWVSVAMFFWGIYYAWRAMHKFYQQGKFKTFVKFMLFNLMTLVAIILLFVLFFLLTVFSV